MVGALPTESVENVEGPWFCGGGCITVGGGGCILAVGGGGSAELPTLDIEGGEEDAGTLLEQMPWHLTVEPSSPPPATNTDSFSSIYRRNKEIYLSRHENANKKKRKKQKTTKSTLHFQKSI